MTVSQLRELLAMYAGGEKVFFLSARDELLELDEVWYSYKTGQPGVVIDLVEPD